MNCFRPLCLLNLEVRIIPCRLSLASKSPTAAYVTRRTRTVLRDSLDEGRRVQSGSYEGVYEYEEYSGV